MTHRKKWLEAIRHDAQRLKDKKPAKLLGLLFYGGTLGLLFIVPLVAGAYLGRWIDSLFEGYSVRWTISFIVLGIVLGIYNIIWFLRRKL